MNRFKNAVLPYAPGCPSALMSLQVLSAAIELCRESHLWERMVEHAVGEEYTDMGVVGDPSYYVSLKFVYDDGAILISPVSDTIDIVDITLTVDDEDRTDYILRGNSLVFEDPPEDGAVIAARLFFAPAEDATELPDFLFREWKKGISAGAIASLVMMPQKPWSAPNLAVVHQQTFLRQVNEAKMLHHRKNLQNPQRLRIRPWL